MVMLSARMTCRASNRRCAKAFTSYAASVPCGFTGEGLPVGLQIVGKRFDDLGVQQASAAFKKAQTWADKRSPLN